MLKDHRLFYRSSIQSSRFKVLELGYVVVLTPNNEAYNQSPLLIKAGFKRVDLPAFQPYRVQDDKPGNICSAWQKQVYPGEVISFGFYGIALFSSKELPVSYSGTGKEPLLTIPTIDISGETGRHSFVARGTEKVYQGHVATLLLPDGKTMFAAWVINHAGHLGPLAKSTDAGLSWSEPIVVPDNWYQVKQTTPTVHRLVDSKGVERLFVFAGCDFPGRIQESYSTDGGKTWTPMADTGVGGECPPKSILSFDNGKKLIMWSDRRDPKDMNDPSPVVIQSASNDGGLTWGPERVLFHVPKQWAQPDVLRTPDGKKLLMLMRYSGDGPSLYSVSTDEAATWSKPKPLSLALTGHRHTGRFAPDGRLVVVMRDMAADYEGTGKVNPTRGHFVAWVGTVDDIVSGREGQYRIKLLNNFAPPDCGYGGLELLPDGTFVATTYIKYEAGPKKHSVVCTRFRLDEIDQKAKDLKQ